MNYKFYKIIIYYCYIHVYYFIFEPALVSPTTNNYAKYRLFLL